MCHPSPDEPQRMPRFTLVYASMLALVISFVGFFATEWVYNIKRHENSERDRTAIKHRQERDEDERDEMKRRQDEVMGALKRIEQRLNMHSH